MLRLLKMLSKIHDFNSIKVRLEPNSDTGECPQTKFQFHKGTIRTRPHLHTAFLIKEFQFHKGTIRTVSQSNIKRHLAISIP